MTKNKAETSRINNRESNFVVTDKHVMFMQQIFLYLSLDTSNNLKKTAKFIQEFQAFFSSKKALESIANIIIAAVNSRQESDLVNEQILRINLKPVDSMVSLISMIGTYIPLDESNSLPAKIKAENSANSVKYIEEYIKSEEETNNVISIPINELSAFVVKELKAKKNIEKQIPILAKNPPKVFIIGTSNNGQPTSIIILIKGSSQVVKKRTFRWKSTRSSDSEPQFA
jgi:hypothetical protein